MSVLDIGLWFVFMERHVQDIVTVDQWLPGHRDTCTPWAMVQRQSPTKSDGRCVCIWNITMGDIHWRNTIFQSTWVFDCWVRTVVCITIRSALLLTISSRAVVNLVALALDRLAFTIFWLRLLNLELLSFVLPQSVILDLLQMWILDFNSLTCIYC